MGQRCSITSKGTYFAQFYRSGAETVKYAGVPQGCEGEPWPVSHWTGQQLPQIESTLRNNWYRGKQTKKKPLKIFCFWALIPNHQMLQFFHSALFCLGFLQARCHRRVNYMYAFSPLYFSPSVCFFSLAGCVRESRCTPLCVYVCVCERTCAGLGSLWTSLWCCCLFIYFPACEGPSSAVRATADWVCVALSAIHQRGAFLMDELVTLAPYSTSAWN